MDIKEKYTETLMREAAEVIWCDRKSKFFHKTLIYILILTFYF